MHRKTIQQRITTSGLLLPLVALLYLLYSLWNNWTSVPIIEGIAFVALTAYLVVEWNNSFALIRVRSRMCAVCFLMMIAMQSRFHSFSNEMVLSLCILINFKCLFRTYQKPKSAVDFFHGFAALGIGSILFPQLLYLVPFYYLSCLIQLRSLTIRSFFGGLLGLLLPYWCYVGYAVWNNQLNFATQKYFELVRFVQPDYSCLTVGSVSIAIFIVFYSFLSAFHYARTAYNDKIRTRMFFNMLITQELVIIILMVLQPQYLDMYLHILIINSAPIIAHYFTLARGRGMSFWFLFSQMIYLATVVIAYYYNDFKVVSFYHLLCQQFLHG